MFRRAFAISVILLLMMPMASAASGESRYIDIERATMTFDGADANIVVKYSVDNLFAKLYIWLLGPEVIKQKLESTFFDLQIQIVEISCDEAVIVASDVITYNNGRYYIGPHQLGQNVDTCVITFSDGYTITLESIDTIPSLVHPSDTAFYMILP
ncbi:MAG: hypothetical protein IB616_00830 [Methanosarcinales archaeon]|nr:MAG: hypothetical protein IB616_00830 [Methanosarcinales archaeon]